MRKLIVALTVLSVLAPHIVRSEDEQKSGTEEATVQQQHELLLDESIEQLIPLDPQDVRKFIQKRDAIESVVEPGPAQMKTATRQINATPGAVPQVIRLTHGYSSTLLFQDSTGAPWPILSTILGSPKSFQAVQPKVESTEDGKNAQNTHSNLINLVPLTSHASSNLVVTLEGAAYPVIIQLLTDSAVKTSRTTDALVVFRLNKLGPNANVPQVGPTTPVTVTPELLSFVHGIPPQGAVQMRTDPIFPNLRVWEFKGQYYLRTPYPAVWPAWTSIANGDDIRVYVMPKAPMLVLSINGVQEKLRIGNNFGRNP